MRTAALATLVMLVLPGVAAACASCIGSPYGDRTYNLAYLGLIMMPFVVVAAIGAVITRCWWMARRRGSGDPTDRELNEETT